MCGITGFLNFKPSVLEKEQIVSDMCSKIVHRGPDGQGIYHDNHVGLGMRRLAIIDLETGQQPIHNETKDVWLVFNGEIYNYIELRSILKGKGHSFYTQSDSEVIIHAYEEYGLDFVHHLRGMFGIAIWNLRTKEFVLVRDRLGIKPIYYTNVNNSFVFASEIKCLLSFPCFSRQVNTDCIDEYFSLGYTMAPNTMFKGVYKLKPGEMLTIHDQTISKQKYWQPQLGPFIYTSEAEALEVFEEKLTEAIKIRLRSDVPFGAFLSGGIDSSLVVAYMAKILDQPVKTFSIGFEDSKYNELTYARQVAERFSTDHHEFIVKPDALDIIEKIVWHCDEPFGDSSAIPTYYVCQMARKHVTMALSGDGGDELFGGYDRYFKFEKLKNLAKAPSFIRALLFKSAKAFCLNEKNKRKIDWYQTRLNAPPFAMYMMGVGLLQDFVKKSLYTNDLLKHAVSDYSFPALKDFQFNWKDYSFEKLPFVDIHSYLVEDILKKVDRMSMANSLEARVPLLDHEFVSFALQVHNNLKVKNHKGKYLMKKALAKFLPMDFIDRPKQGFALPINEWFRHELRELTQDTLLNNKFQNRGYFNQKFVTTLVNDHLALHTDNSEILWMLVNFELWHRHFIDN